MRAFHAAHAGETHGTHQTHKNMVVHAVGRSAQRGGGAGEQVIKRPKIRQEVEATSKANNAGVVGAQRARNGMCVAIGWAGKPVYACGNGWMKCK